MSIRVLPLSYTDADQLVLDNEMNKTQQAKVDLIESSLQDRGGSLNYISRLFYFEKADIIAVIEEHMKYIRFYDGAELHELHELKLAAATIGSVEFVVDHGCFVVTGNDKFIYFYEQGKFSLQRRFQMPETQTHLSYCHSTDTLYTGGLSGRIYAWDMSKVYSDYFMEQIKYKKETYKMVLVDDFPK